MMSEDAAIRQPGFQAPACPGLSVAAPPARPALSARLSSCGWLVWPPPVGRAVRTCGYVIRAGWLARQAIVSEGQEAGRA